MDKIISPITLCVIVYLQYCRSLFSDLVKMNFEMRIVGFVLVAFVCSSSVKGAEEENYLVKLTDDDFEHKTQISTGMTTGDWLVIM